MPLRRSIPLDPDTKRQRRLRMVLILAGVLVFALLAVWLIPRVAGGSSDTAHPAPENSTEPASTQELSTPPSSELVPPLVTADPGEYAEQVALAACSWNAGTSTEAEVTDNLRTHVDPDGSGRPQSGDLMNGPGAENRMKLRADNIEGLFRDCAPDQQWSDLGASGQHQVVEVLSVKVDDDHDLWGHEPWLSEDMVGGPYDTHYATVSMTVTTAFNDATVGTEGVGAAPREVTLSMKLNCAGPVDAAPAEPMCAFDAQVNDDWY